MELVVTNKQLIAQDTVAVTLEPDSGSLPVATPGSHITLEFSRFERNYSLTRGFESGTAFEIQVLNVHEGRGASTWIHERLAIGDKLRCTRVANDFELVRTTAKSIFIAGGIGITPFLSMASAVSESGNNFELHHVVRSLKRQPPMATELERNLQTYVGRDIDFKKIIGEADPDSHIYVCGPVGLMAAVRSAAEALSFSRAHIHTETFGAGPSADDQAIEVHLALSGTSFLATPGRPLLDTLQENGAWIGQECRRGQCGSCLVEVIEGEPIHRDAIDPSLREGHMCPCVSWAQGSKLVLNL